MFPIGTIQDNKLHDLVVISSPKTGPGTSEKTKYSYCSKKENVYTVVIYTLKYFMFIIIRIIIISKLRNMFKFNLQKTSYNHK